MRFEVEIVCEEILPAVRSIVADRLVEDYGLKQSEVAERIGVTQPAVSQYLSGSRADRELKKELLEDPQVDILMDDAASKAAKNEDFSPEVNQVVQNIRDKGIMKEKFEDAGRIL